MYILTISESFSFARSFDARTDTDLVGILGATGGLGVFGSTLSFDGVCTLLMETFGEYFLCNSVARFCTFPIQSNDLNMI